MRILPMFHIICCFKSFFVVCLAQVNYKCPKPDGLFPDVSFCDKYYDCFDGIAEVRVCPDGLVFDPLSRKREPCDHYFNVDCEDRLQLRKYKKHFKLNSTHSIYSSIKRNIGF